MGARRPPTRMNAADDKRRMDALDRANALESRASNAYRQGVGMLTGAVKDAEATRSTAAGAEAKVRQTESGLLFQTGSATNLYGTGPARFALSLFPLSSSNGAAT